MRSFLLLLLTLSASLRAGNAFFVMFPVQAPAGATGQDAQAATAAGATLLRQQIPGEAAYQVAGPDGPVVGRIFTRLGTGSYCLTDAGSQWATSVGQGQVLLAITETFAGQYQWSGKAYAGAVQGTIAKADIVGGHVSLPAVLMSEVPAPLLGTADDHWVSLSIPALVDPSALASGLVLWRQSPGDPSWQKLADLPVSASTVSYQDNSVTTGAAYTYGVSLRYPWPGGGQKGALPAEAGSYVTFARGLSSLIWASKVQPTPTPFPTLVVAKTTPDLGSEAWVAYPNPNRDGHVRLAFHMVKKGSYHARVFSLDGRLVYELRGEAAADSWPLPTAELTKMASGIYLVDLRLTYAGENESILPLRKLALVR
jgi:hypothetical protein